MSEELNEYTSEVNEAIVQNEVSNVIEVDFGRYVVEEPIMIKSLEQELTVEMLDGIIGKIVYVPQNEHMGATHADDELKPVNVWFAGTVAGYERAVIKYDYMNNTFLDEAKVTFNLLLTDGVGYILSPTKCEIIELTREGFLKMIDEHQAKQIADQAKEDALKSILLPGRDF